MDAKTLKIAVVAFMFPLLVGRASGQTTWYVDDDACPGPGTGSQSDPFCSIQRAIDESLDGDDVIVAPGVYNETIDFIGKAIKLHTSDGPYVTTIDATGLDDHVVVCISTEGPNTVLEGFTLTGGFAPQGGGMYNVDSNPTVNNCTFLANHAFDPKFFGNGNGGGMYNLNSEPIVQNCLFVANSVFGDQFHNARGAGMYNENSNPAVIDTAFIENSAVGSWGVLGGGMYNAGSDPTVTNCTFVENEAQEGAGMYNAGSSPRVTNCTFVENEAPGAASGAGMRNNGGSPTVTDCLFNGNFGTGMSNERSNPTVRSCTFSGNLGSGMRNDTSDPTVINCLFVGNVVSSSGQWTGGAGMYNTWGASPTIFNCKFVNNEVGATGGAIFNFLGASPTIVNCLFSGNTAGTTGGVMYSLATSGCNCTSTPRLTNCILWGNSYDQVVDGEYAVTTIMYSDVAQGWTGSGSNNIAADPLFIDPDGPDDDPNTWEDNDYHLAAGSPCIDAGDNRSVPADTSDLDADGDVVERTPLDLGDNLRFTDDCATSDTGFSDPPAYVKVVDMGAYEYQPSDLNNDSAVDLADYAEFDSCFTGPNADLAPECGGTDSDCDGDVDLADFAELQLAIRNQ